MTHHEQVPVEHTRIQAAAMLRQQGIILSTSTINDWMHASADKLFLLYLRLKSRIISQSDYVQADEVPFNIADRDGKVRKGYAWQVSDCSDKHLGRFFYYDKGSRAKTVSQGLPIQRNQQVRARQRHILQPNRNLLKPQHRPV